MPDEVHRTYRQRAAAAGMSLREYLRAEFVAGSRLSSPDELSAEVAERLRVEGDEGFMPGSSAEVVREDRDTH